MCEDHQLNEVFGIDVEVRGRPAGLHSQEGSGDLQEGHPSVTKGASPSAKHPLKVPFTKA